MIKKKEYSVTISRHPHRYDVALIKTDILTKNSNK